MAKRKGIMLCYPFDEIRLKRWEEWMPAPTIVQPKLDGIRCRVICDDKKVTLLSSTEEEIVSVPHIEEAFLPLVGGYVELDGELYSHDLPFNEIESRVTRTVNLHPSYDDIEYHIFDIVSFTDSQYKRILYLQQFIENTRASLSKYIKRVEYYICSSLEDIMGIYERLLEDGYEGIVVRNFFGMYERKRSPLVMKFKPKKDDFYKIVGFKQMLDKDRQYKPLLGSLHLQGDDGTKFWVGSGMTDSFRDKYWPKEEAKKLLGKLCHVKYQNLTSKKVPHFPVFVEVEDG